MVDDGLQYDRMVEGALRGVVRQALDVAARKGLPGAHHFYVTFRTRSPGVAIPEFLLAQYPEEMTIVLQHQFRDLIVDKDGFSVTLSFGGRPAVLVVPFSALAAFVDPSVRFGLQFDRRDKAGEKLDGAAAPVGASEPTPLPVPEKRPLPAPTEGEDGQAPAEAAADDAAKPEDAASKVVKLDSFRKK